MLTADIFQLLMIASIVSLSCVKKIEIYFLKIKHWNASWCTLMGFH